MRRSILVLLLSLLFAYGVTWWYQRPNIQLLGQRGSIIVHHSVNDTIHHAEYVVVIKIDDQIVVEAITGPGPESTIVLKDAEAEVYLREIDIDF